MLNKSEIANNCTYDPFLKWAGGKRWFVSKFPDLFPNDYNRYIEPFLGSGAVFFHLNPEQATLGDLNRELIDTYLAIKDEWEKVYAELHKHQRKHSKDYYYEIRSNNYKVPYKKAARLIYLNRTCWNGLYRVNQQGKFNVPIGTKDKVILATDDFEGISSLLKNVNFLCEDFESLINKAQKDDFLFVDPPYTVSHNNNGFIKYNEKIFSWEDQERLKESLVKAKERGAKIISTNACHESIIELYQDEFNIEKVSRASIIAGKPSARKKYDELLIKT